MAKPVRSVDERYVPSGVEVLAMQLIGVVVAVMALLFRWS